MVAVEGSEHSHMDSHSTSGSLAAGRKVSPRVVETGHCMQVDSHWYWSRS